MIIALQTLVFFRHTLLAVLDRILRPYYKRLVLSFKNNGPVCEEDEPDDQVYSEFNNEKGVVFFPPVYMQRYAAVSDCLMDKRWCGKLQKVADLGYCDMSFIKYLKDVPGVQTILGVDVEKVPLRCAWDMLGCDDYPFKSDNALHVLLLQGNAADPDYRLIGCDAVVAIEMIEHMLPHDLERLVHTIFGFIKPMVVVITTPNKDFNVLFKNMGKNGMRHWDHRFEWTREQFNDWCSNIVERYPNYQVMCKGVGPPPPGAQYVGCCSQLALFSAKEYQKQQDLNLNSLRVLVSSSPEPEGKSVLNLDWEDPSEAGPILSPSYTPSPTSFFDLQTSEEQSFKIPVEQSTSTIPPPALSYRDKMLQCNLPAEAGKNFMMFSDEHEYCWTLLPRRRGEGDYRVYEIEDVASRLNCTTLQVKKFSKTTQRLFANKPDTLANTRHVVEEIKHLTKMLNFNKNISTERLNSSTTWNNINWGDNAPYWNQYYAVVREYKYPFETKSEECLILELISDEIHRLTDRQGSGEAEPAAGAATLQIPLAHLVALVSHITTDEDRVRDLLEWNGYEVVGDMVIYHRTLVLPDDESDEDNWRDNGSSKCDIGSDRSDPSSIPDYYGRSLRRALDRKVRKLSSMSEADIDISTELDLVVCRLMKLALRMANGCELPLHPHWLQCKLYDLLSLTEKSIDRRMSCNSAPRSYRAIEYGMEEDKSQRLALMKAEDDITAKRIEDTYRHLVQFKDTADYMAEESSHDTSKLIDSEFEMGSPCVTPRGVFIDEDLNSRAVFIAEDLKSFPILSSTENVPESGGIESWMNESLAPFVHQPPQYENSTDDTEPKSKETPQRSPTKKKRRLIFPEESSIATDIDVEGQPQTDLRQHKVKNNKNNRKARQRPSYNSLLKNYTIHLAQAEKDYGTSYMVEHHTDQPTAVKPIHCSVINLCFDEINKENTGANEWSKLEDRAENNDLKETDLATEERQIMSVVMDDVAALQDNLSPNDTIETHDTYPIPTGVGGDSPKYEENLTCYTEPMFLSDLNEPSTSKGIRHINMDAQCGPDTVSIDCPLMSRTPSINLQKVCKTGIYIGDSSTELNIKKKVNFATSTSEYGTKVYYGNGSTENAEILPMETLLKTMCDTSTLPWTTKRNNYEHSNTKFAHKHVSSATTDSCTILNDVNLAKYKEMPVSISMIDENCQSPSRYNCAIEAKLIKAVFSNFNEMDDSLSDHSTVNATSSRLFKTPSIQKEVHSNDNSKHVLRTLYDKQYAPPKLSFVGAHVHSYKERGVSEDILYQGVWQKHRTLWAPKKRSLGDIAKKSYITRKENSKEKIKSVRSRSSPSDLKNCSASLAKRTPLRLSASKDFISKNIILSSSGRAPKAKKSHTLKKPAVAKLKQCNFNEKAALVFDSKNQLSSPIVVKKEHAIVTETKRDIAVMRNDPLRPHLITANSNETMKDMNIPDCFSYSIAKQQIVSNNATAIERKPDVLSKNASIVETEFMQNNPTVVETKIDVISKNVTMVETKPSKTAIIVETKSYDVIPNDATVVETTPNFVANWLTPVETKPDFRSNHPALAETQSGLICNDAMRSEFKPDLVTGKTTLVENKCGTVKIQPCFPNYTKIIEMKPESASNDAEAAQADPEFMSNFESLAKLKQDIISSNEVLARLQQDFEQKVEKRILGTKARHVLNKKPNKVPSRSRLSTTPQKLDNIRQTKKSTSTLRSTPLRPKVDQKKTPGIPIKTTSKTLIRKISLKNLKSTKGHQKTTNVSLSAPKAKKTVNFKDPIRITRPSSALPAIALTKAPVKVNSQQPLKAKVNPHIRPRSADTTGVKPQVSRPPMKRSIWMPKQSAETQKLTKDVLKVHDESHPERNYLVYCNEVDSSDSTDCSILYEDPDIIMSKFYSSSSRTSSNCSSPNSIVTVRSRLKRQPGLKSPLSKNTPSNKDDRKTLTPKSATNRQKYNMTTNKDFNVKPRPAPKVNANEKYAAQKGGRAEYKNVFVAQLSSEAASPLQSSSPKGRKCLSPSGCTSPKKILKKAILKIKDLDEDIILNEKSVDSFLAPQQSLKTMSHDDIPQIHRVSDSKSNQEVNQSAKEVILESKICEDVTGATYSEITSVMREIIEDTLIEIDETIGQRSKWPDFCAKTSSVGVPSKKKFDSSQRKNSSMLTDVAEMQKHNISIAENTRGSSIKDLYERKEQLTFKPAGPLAIQAFSGFSMNSPPPVGDQKPDYVNLVDSETGSVATAIPTRLAASEELYISGRSSESYQSCLVDEEMVVPDWLFRVVSQNQDNAEYDDDEENYPMPMPTGVPVPPIALQEFDINGNIAEGAPTVARTGAGDGRGIHSDQSQHSSGHGTSLSSSANSSGLESTMVIDPSVYPSRYDSMLESLSDDDDAEAESSTRPVCQRPTGPGTPMSSTERIYTLLHQAATSDVDADVSSMGTDDNVSRNHEL